ncbi:uncharacterized protein LOC125951795 [Anopheles darlingi]|uniref:uncharacterized protein LOC125951795 n=1 Tax=Anopheles darlingi TaxID=43151 RepID=UPI00210053F2|nr:uncharacterized protein LOC125951795 [Anopheles darlingi]
MNPPPALAPRPGSQTWPSSIFAASRRPSAARTIVQLDAKGRTYSSAVSALNFLALSGGVAGTEPPPPPPPSAVVPPIVTIGEVARVPLSPTPFVPQQQQQQQQQRRTTVGFVHARPIDGDTSSSSSGAHHRTHRSESLKIDNWDYIYTEKCTTTRSVLHAPNTGSCLFGVGALAASATIATATVATGQPHHHHHQLLQHHHHLHHHHHPGCSLPCSEHRCISGQAAAKVSTLRRHYYPEGAWGWIVLAVATLQAILNHGVQLAGPLYLLPAGHRFHQPAVNSCGKWPAIAI